MGPILPAGLSSIWTCVLNKIFHYFSSFWFPWGCTRILVHPPLTVKRDHPPFPSPTTHIEGLVCICSFQQTIVRRFVWPTTVAFDRNRQRVLNFKFLIFSFSFNNFTLHCSSLMHSLTTLIFTVLPHIWYSRQSTFICDFVAFFIAIFDV